MSRRYTERPNEPRQATLYRVDDVPMPAADVYGCVFQGLYGFANANSRLTIDNDTVSLIAATQGITAAFCWEIIDDLERNGSLRRIGLSNSQCGRWSA